jgi:UDP-glucose 6-dehydrogenase
VKLLQNGFFAVKVAYWNEARALADKLGLDWADVHGAVMTDGRIHPSHTQVPGPDGCRGFGGTCLPKDLAQLVHHLEAEAYVTGAALHRNRHDRAKGV